MKRTGTFSHYRMNSRLGMFSFITHRISGTILLISGLIILLSLSVVMLGRVGAEEVLIALRQPVFGVLAHIVSIILFWHVLNGLKILIIDLFRAGYMHKVLTIITIITFILGIVFYFIYLFPKVAFV